VAAAGGLFLPGAGAISTSRAGASVAAADDGEALALNPADLASAGSGTFIQLGISAIDYFMSFHRNGTYDAINEEALPYEGERYPTITNDPKPPLGIGSYQPVPLIAVVTDFGGRIPGLHAAAGLYAPNAYPFRDMNNVNGQPFFIPNDQGSYDFPAAFDGAPPPTRYDVIHEEAAIILPSLAVSYRPHPKIDVGARFSAGTANLKSTVAVWGLTNYTEWVKQDGIFTLDAKGFVYNWQLGTNVHATPNIDIAAQFTAPIYIHAQGDAISTNGPAVTLNGAQVVVSPLDNGCKAGLGSTGHLRGCVDVELPMTATLGGRYKFLDESGALKGDVEVDVGWEHWGAGCDYDKDPLCLDPSDFHVTVNAQAATVTNPDQGIPLKNSLVSHGLRDTYSVRLGGSWHFPVGNNAVIARGGVGYDTAAAKPGWERADFDGAARTMVAAGASYKMNKVQIDAGFGVMLEGTRTDERTCNPTLGMPSPTNAGPGCAGTPGYTGGTPGQDNPLPDRKGPDPINPIIVPNVQAESPVNEGTFKSHYLFIMLGASYRF
jgi:long-subunit fatty acid transport protein